jgi:predicted acetyltransferase
MKVKRMDEKIIQISEMRFLTHIARQALWEKQQNEHITEVKNV